MASAFDTGTNDHEYFASTVETINIARDPVTSLATVEPSHVFDIVWNMNLNDALYALNAPYIIDSTEEGHYDNKYTLGTDGLTVTIEIKENSGTYTYTHTDSTTRTGATLDALAKQLKTDGSTVTLLDSDGLQDVASTIVPLITSRVSDYIGNSLSTQTGNINTFMESIKRPTGTYNWYSNNTDNKQSVTTQVKIGLAKLFDRNPELNNLIGSAANSSAFLDSSKIALALQDTSNSLYTKLFSEKQLMEVLEAVADRGSRINGTHENRKFNFEPGDSITAVVKVVDSDSTDDTNDTETNIDRWLVTLQHVSS